MTRELEWTGGDRVLVFAPHPDDETIGAGELIQQARGAGAQVRVVFATDGDNNPLPQLWLERRLWIGPDDRRRWGLRRRAEATAALRILGVTEAVFLGWHDRSLRGLLSGDPSAVATIGAAIDTFEPTCVVHPAQRDRHPDHSALAAMVELVMRRSGSTASRLAYIVHGPRSTQPGWHVRPDSARYERKVRALQCHETQLSLSRRRMMRWIAPPETFD